MKTLYVSDLDGTLFNTQKRVSAYTVDVLNRCIDQGMLFSVATARMPYGCDYRLSDINLHLPNVLTNGVFLYDFKSAMALSIESMDPESARRVIEVFNRHGQSCFVYTWQKDGIHLFYGDQALKEQTQYYSDRALVACAEVTMIGDLASIVGRGEPFYLALTGSEETLAPIRDEIQEIPGVGVAFYLNIYNGLFCIEVFSKTASKKSALQKLREHVHCDELVVFGDNLNDLSMIEIADRSYATGNALDEVKQKVNEVLEDCDHDGVARFLAKEFGL